MSKRAIKPRGIDRLAERRNWDPRYKKGPNYVGARDFDLISPKGVRFRGRSILDFVRTHSHLFETRDLKWKAYPQSGNHTPQCYATKGLARLNPATKNCMRHWRGWHWYSEAPVVKSISNNGFVVVKFENGCPFYLDRALYRNTYQTPAWRRTTLQANHFETLDEAKSALRRVCRKFKIPFGSLNVVRMKTESVMTELERFGPFSWSWKLTGKITRGKELHED